MANQVVQLSVKINSDTGQLEVLGAKFQATAQKAREAEGSFKKLSGEAGSLLKSFLPFATGAGVIAFFTAAVKGAEEENEALRRLKFGLEATGVSWQMNQQAVLAWSSAIQSATRFSDTEALSTLERLVRVTGSLSAAQRASQLAMGLSVSSGKSLADNERLLVDLINGNERALIAVNKEFGAFTRGAKTTQEAIDRLQVSFQDAAFQEESLTKTTASAKNAFGDFQEQIGRAFIPALTQILRLSTGIIKVFETWGSALSGQVLIAITAFKSLGDVMTSVFSFNKATIGAAFAGAMNQMKATVTTTATDIADIWRKNDQEVSAVMENRGRIFAQTSKQQEEEAIKQAELVAQLELELDQKMASIGQETLAKKQNLLAAEIAARRNKIATEVKDETARAKLLDKLHLEEQKRNQELTKAEIQMKTAAALQIASISIQALQALNSMADLKSKEDARRAKFLLALEKSIAIAIAIREAQKGGPLAAGIATAQIALISAQFAQQSKAINQAQSASAAGATNLSVSTPLPGGSNLETNLPGGGSAAAGSVFAPSAGGGGGGGGGTTIVQNITVQVNISPQSLELSERRSVLRALAEEMRGTASEEARNFALTSANLASKHSGLAA